YIPDAVSPELVLFYGITDNEKMAVQIIDNQGSVLHSWILDLFKLWPDMSHIPPRNLPKADPGGEINGLEITRSGDIIFNFSPAGLMRLDFCGNVVWRLPINTHHSVQNDHDGGFIVLEQVLLSEPDQVDQDGSVEVFEENIIWVAQDGSVLDRISINDLLLENGFDGLYYLAAQDNFGIRFDRNDNLHTNDAEMFPPDMEEGYFGRGDVVVSMRNLNTILVFNMETRMVKYLHTGSMVMQHDPDFISGNEISVFDNHSVVGRFMYRDKRPENVSSRILLLDASNGTEKVFFEGRENTPFFTDIMGTHQWLPNGNVLITESRWGRVFELTPNAELAWEYNNILSTGVAEGLLGVIFEGRRLPPEFNPEKLRSLAAACISGF
ncbi:MAG: arylsulfotransferase family protein, partial [Paracoccaceae bacterium]